MRRSRRRQVAAALEQSDQARRDLEFQLARTRDAYDRALVDSGVVLLQQVSADVDGYHVSSSMSDVLGWDPMAFLAPGILRGMVHPDDLATFAVAFPPPAPAAAQEDVPEAVETAVIDLTDSESSTDDAASTPPPAAIDDLVVRFRTAGGTWAHVQLRPAGGPPPSG